jgi:hypothetical protein
MVQKSFKTIVITDQTYDSLRKLGNVTESFNDVILKLIEKTATSQSSFDGRTGRIAVVDRNDPEAIRLNDK